ncbi:phage portal protein [Schaalia sp. ZJ405]|uniref:phage portal protein n=1 Tax=Schaalia sp. ZJ405 TaxID=2709403 RepID=UPI0013ED2049|nr:phage portal protein [Schaalia sp. ZJ405]QPK80810.1 phage portal protein [Schaalia sp. ZJ405]
MIDATKTNLLATTLTAPTHVRGMDAETARLLGKAWEVWLRVLPKNRLLNVYYDGHRAFRDLGISVPPQMQRTRAALGWPAKAVQALARKHVFEGFSSGGQTDPFEVVELLAANDFTTQLSQAITSAYKHACAFLTITAGDRAAGDPPVVIQARDALMSAALWDQRRRAMKAFLTIDSTDDLGEPDGAVFYTHEETWQLTRKVGAWSAVPLGNATGQLLVEPIIYDPQLGRPFGRSRITREVRYLTDAAIRTLVRTETSAEFFATPQRYVLGVDDGTFDGRDRWSAVIGRLLALTPNENGDVPTVGQFPQMSMSPHLEMYRQLAQNFCAATNLPTSSVGIFADNPTSAEAMQAAEAALADEAEAQWRIFAGPLRRLLGQVVMLRDNLTEIPAQVWRTDVRWTPARYASPAASADFAVKMVQAFPTLSESPTLMRRAGLTEADLAAIQTETASARSSALLDRLATAGDSQEPETVEAPPSDVQGVDMKAKFDALGVAVRAGVAPESALKYLGLEGVKMSGAVPVSLRLPEKDTVALEEA